MNEEDGNEPLWPQIRSILVNLTSLDNIPPLYPKEHGIVLEDDRELNGDSIIDRIVES